MGPGAPGPEMFGMGGPGGDPGMQTPGPPNPMAGPAMEALGALSPKSSNPTASMQKVDEALSLAYQLIGTVISQVQMQNPQVAKDGHAVAKMILSMKSAVHEATAVGPTPDMMLGMGGGGPSPMGPGSPAAGPVGGP